MFLLVFYSDLRSRICYICAFTRICAQAHTSCAFMHITHTPSSRHAYIYPPITHHDHVMRITSCEAVFLIRSTLPMSNVPDSFTLIWPSDGPSDSSPAFSCALCIRKDVDIFWTISQFEIVPTTERQFNLKRSLLP